MHAPKRERPKRAPASLRRALGLAPGRMGPAESIVAQALVAAGHTTAETADMLGRARQTVSEALTRRTAKDVLKEHEEQLAQDWLKASKVAASRGRHDPAQAGLVAIGAVESESKGGGGGGVVVNVGIALPGTPGGD